MKFLVFAILFLSFQVSAEMPEYRVLEGNQKSAVPNFPKFKISKSKSDYKIEEIQFGKSTFKLEVQENFFNHEAIPFFEVTLENKYGYKVFALLATSGTSGRSFHYFFENGKKITYSGHHPEIFKDEDGQYLSVEMDGSTRYLTTWKLSKKGFRSEKTEVIQ